MDYVQKFTPTISTMNTYFYHNLYGVVCVNVFLQFVCARTSFLLRKYNSLNRAYVWSGIKARYTFLVELLALLGV